MEVSLIPRTSVFIRIHVSFPLFFRQFILDCFVQRGYLLSEEEKCDDENRDTEEENYFLPRSLSCPFKTCDFADGVYDAHD